MKRIIIFLILVSLVVLTLGIYLNRESNLIDENKTYSIERVIDGDTIVVNSLWNDLTIRMLGINTPETVDPRRDPECFGKEASDATKKLLSGHSVQLKKNPNRELKDRYGRYLLYVYRDDGLFVNEYLISNGFAREYTYGSPYVFRNSFRKKEDEAKHLGLGLWASCPDIRNNSR